MLTESDIITYEELFEAFIKLKTHIYYDTSELHLRNSIATFESSYDNLDLNNFEEINSFFKSQEENNNSILEYKLTNLLSILNNNNQNIIKKYLNEIQLFFLPKKILGNSTDNSYVSNVRTFNTYNLEKTTVFANFPIELHLICVIWLMRYGYKLDSKLDKSCVGNRLVLTTNQDKIVSGSAFFKPYYKQYQLWRDNAIIEAKRKLDQKNDIAFINLDLKDFYHSIELDFNTLEAEIWGASQYNFNIIHELFKQIHFHYTQLIASYNYPFSDFKLKIKDKVVLPISVSSSYTIANWYLSDFDKSVKAYIPQIYYSRYVDDIILVIENPDFQYLQNTKFEKSESPIENNINNELNINNINFNDLTSKDKLLLNILYPLITIIPFPKGYFSNIYSDSKNIVNNENINHEFIFTIKSITGTFFQSEKTLIYYFNHLESTAVIDKLTEELRERSSEFRDFPEDESDNISFNESAYHLIFDGTDGKIRTLKDYKENRYGLSVFLAHRIFTSLLRNNSSEEELENYKTESNKIITLFKGINNLEYHSLWEKLFTYFIVNNDYNGFIIFYKNCIGEITKLCTTDLIGSSKITYENVSKSLFSYLFYCIELSLALNGNFIKQDSIYYFDLENYTKRETIKCKDFVLKLFYSTFQNNSFKYRMSNLLRHHYVNFPLMNFTNISISNPLNFVSTNFINI